MGNLLFSFNALHKGLGKIETEVLVYEDRVTLKKKVTGAFAMNTALPAEITAFYGDLSGINFSKATIMKPVGLIELTGISANHGTVKTVDVQGKIATNGVDIANALGNPYVIPFNKDKEAMEGKYNELRTVFEKYKANNSNGNVNVINAAQEESALDKIKKLKELLDIGAITQEEFDAQKSELLKNI